MQALGVAAVALLGGAPMIAARACAQALPAYAASTGKPHARHQNPAGRGSSNGHGEAFAAYGHQPPGK
jgi:hypothetical protein